jgi:hypothetical protein
MSNFRFWLKTALFCVVRLCSSEITWRFGGKYRFNLQSRRELVETCSKVFSTINGPTTQTVPRTKSVCVNAFSFQALCLLSHLSDNVNVRFLKFPCPYAERIWEFSPARPRPTKCWYYRWVAELLISSCLTRDSEHTLWRHYTLGGRE